MTVETAFTQFPMLQTRRFIVRPFRPTDDQALFEIFSDVETMQYYGSEPQLSLEETRAMIHDFQKGYEARKAIHWAITHVNDETVIGSCSLHQFACKFKRVEVGYILRRALWGQGIMSEVMTAVLDFGFYNMEVHRVEAIIDNANHASTRLLLKLGFTFEGRLRERYLLGEVMMDEWMYSLLRPEWLANRSDVLDRSQRAEKHIE